METTKDKDLNDSIVQLGSYVGMQIKFAKEDAEKKKKALDLVLNELIESINFSVIKNKENLQSLRKEDANTVRQLYFEGVIDGLNNCIERMTAAMKK